MAPSALPPELAQFAADHIALLLGLPPADALGVAASLGDLPTAKDVDDWVAGFLGDSAEARDFGDEFKRRRFAGKAKAAPPAKETAASRRPESAPRSQIENGQRGAQPGRKKEPASGKQQQQQEKSGADTQQWTNLPGVRVVNRKNEHDEVLYRPKRATPSPKPATPPPPSAPSPAPPPQNPPESPKPKPKPKSKKPDTQIQISVTRKPCPCLASQHGLLTNCLSCGRIICSREGPGACFTCGKLVLSREQQLESLASRMSAGLDRAREGLSKMLQFQAESAQRTKIRDAAADFDIAATVTDRWASKEERERAVMRLKEEARKEEERKRIRVVDLDLEKLGFNEASLPDDPPKPAKVVIPTNFAREDPVVKAAEPEDEDIGRIRRNPTIAAPPIFIPPGSVAKPKARKKMIWEKSKETPESEPAKPVVRAERQRKGGGKWARIQHELDPGGFDFGDDVDDILEGTEVDCG